MKSPSAQPAIIGHRVGGLGPSLPRRPVPPRVFLTELQGDAGRSIAEENAKVPRPPLTRSGFLGRSTGERVYEFHLLLWNRIASLHPSDGGIWFVEMSVNPNTHTLRHSPLPHGKHQPWRGRGTRRTGDGAQLLLELEAATQDLKEARGRS